MVESGIRVGGVPLEEYLIDKEKKKLYDDTQAEIAEQKKLTYYGSGVCMTVKHDKRPSKVRHVTRQEYYMKENIKSCTVGAEYVLTIFQDGLPQNMNSLCERFVHWEINIKPGGVRQAFMKVWKRYPDLFTMEKDGNTMIFTMIPAACKLEHGYLLDLWRKKITWQGLVEVHPELKRALTSKVLDSPEGQYTELAAKIDHLTQVLHGMGKEQDNQNSCINGLEERLHRAEEWWKKKHYLEDDTGSRHTLDINVNFNLGRKEE